MMRVCISFNSLPSWLILDPLQRMLEQMDLRLDWQPLLDAPIHLAETAPSPDKTPRVDKDAYDKHGSESDPLATYKARRARARADFLSREHERICDRLGIDYEAGRRRINPLHLSLGLLWMKTVNPAQQTYFDYCRAAWQQLFVEDIASVNSPEPGVINSPERLIINSPERFVINSPEPAFINSLETNKGVEILLRDLGVPTTGFAAFAKSEARGLEVNQSRLLESGVLRAPAFIVGDEVFNGRQHLPLITWMLQGKIGLPPV